MESVGTSDGKNYNVIPRTMGYQMCCLRAVTEDTTQRKDGFIIPDRIQKNERALYFEIMKIGRDVNEITGLKVGDFVFVDALARFSDTYPISFINCSNILFKTDERGHDIIALKYRVIAKIIEPTEEKNEMGFIEISNIDPYGMVKSIGDGCIDRGYKVGDHISVSSNANMYMIGTDKYFDYDFRTPMFKFA